MLQWNSFGRKMANGIPAKENVGTVWLHTQRSLQGEGKEKAVEH